VSSAQQLFTGSRVMYVSADGKYVLGWNPNGFDIFFGVQALTTAPTNSLFKGLYYTAAMGDSPPVGGQVDCSSSFGTSSFWGGTSADGIGDEIEHQRLFYPICPLSQSNGSPAPTDFGTDDYTQFSSSQPTPDDLGNLIALGAGGSGFVSISDPSANPGTFSLAMGVQATYTQSGSVYLIPWGIVNAASWQPVTAGVAPGELLNLFVIGLSGTTATVAGGSPCPTSLGEVQVLIGGVLAPVCDVIPANNQITVQAPYELANASTYTVSVQVNVNGAASNTTSVYLAADADSGFFSVGQNGIGYAIAEHANGSLISPSSPAQPGETIVLALGGMGAVSPTVADGAIGPASPLSDAQVYTASDLAVYFNDYTNGTFAQGTVAFAGLYPYFVGLYQMNLTLPTGIGPNTNPGVYMEIATGGADVNQVTLPVSGTAAAALPALATAGARPRTLRGPHHLSRQIAAPQIHPASGLTRRVPHPLQ